jgi:protein arginine kinase
MTIEPCVIPKSRLKKIPGWFDSSGPESDVIISTRIRLARNLENYHFPLRASLAERKDIFEQVANVFIEHKTLRSFEPVNFGYLSKLEQQYLVEERVVSPDLLKIDGDRGVIYDTTRFVNIMVNEEDHIRLQGIRSGFCIHEIWSVLDMLDDSLGQRLAFSFDRQRGFLTCSPTNSGTGLHISFLMHLPGLVLTKAIDSVLQGASQMGVSTRGFLGEHSDIVGNFFQLSNQATMGTNEIEFLDATKELVLNVVKYEREARRRLVKDAKLELTDKIYRAFGILTNARTLSMQEFLNLSSAIRLGIECRLFDNITIKDLNRITMLIMPAHIQVYNGNSGMDKTEILIGRAELVRELLGKKKRSKSSQTRAKKERKR